MNIQELDILNALLYASFTNQRELASRCGHSLGTVNRCLGSLVGSGMLDEHFRPTEAAKTLAAQRSPKNAIILAAGYGMRMVPINNEHPKALVEINGESLIERLIKQLREAGVERIFIVVGFMKERFEYLIDKFGAELIVNSSYSSKNNLHSLACAAKNLSNSYIVPCDIWCAKNPFSPRELYSWYMVSERLCTESSVRVNRRCELVHVPKSAKGNAMIGITYVTEPEASELHAHLKEMCADPRFDQSFWEEALSSDGKMSLYARVVDPKLAVEINTYEQLRELDSGSDQLRSDKIDVIAQALAVSLNDICDISVLKKGMTNRSFLFCCRGKKYIMRIPGEGTEQLIDRHAEAEVFRVIEGRGICEDIIYINPENGFKITEFIEGAHCCDPFDRTETRLCMRKLRELHESGLHTKHEFDIFERIEFYESLRDRRGSGSAYRDYSETKTNVFSLRSFIESIPMTKTLTHIDAVPDNFLIFGDGEVRIIDWEYAAMQDPHVDIAMFCIYAMYDREHVDMLIDDYFSEGCPRGIRLKIYAYIAACGLLWSNWCEYKLQLGVEFGEYSLRQYRYAKDYFRIVREEAIKENEQG